MDKHDDQMNLLLIEEDAKKLALIKQEIDTNRVRCHFHTIGHGKSALAYLRQIAPYNGAPAPDLVLFDFSEPDRDDWSLLTKLAMGPKAITCPIVLLTSRASEELLEAHYEQQRRVSLFAPLDLTLFLQRMTHLRHHKFTEALSLISNSGLITVRLPGSILKPARQNLLTAMSA